MAFLTIDQVNDLQARHPELFNQSFFKQHRAPVLIAAAMLYGVFCWWFFAIGETFRKSDWDIAGAYMADWVSWEVRPDIEIATDGAMTIVYPKFSPLGDNPAPEWIEKTTAPMTRTVPSAAAQVPGGAAADAPQTGGGFMGEGAQLGSGAPAEAGAAAPKIMTEDVVTRAVIAFGSSSRVEVLPNKVSAFRGGESVMLNLSADGKVAAQEGPLPSWAVQRQEGGKVLLSFGVAGRAEVEFDTVKIRRRFIGWANFLFDTQSPFWGKSTGEVLALLRSGERIDPAQSNLSLAWSNVLNNSEWQHLDVWTKLLQTIVMAFVGTLFASILAFPLAFLAARNIMRSSVVNQVCKRLFDFLRSVDMFIWALFFTRAFGPGPLAGISAIFLTDTGTLGKLYSESLENIDDKQREGVKSVGASPVLVQRYGVLPQVLPIFASHALYFWESNTRSATIIGAVGAGGIGLKLWEAMRTNQDWENVAYMVILILLVVYVFDAISNTLRSRLMATQR